MAAEKILLGIDLGASNVRVSYMVDSGEAAILANREGENATPAIVYLEEMANGEMRPLVGEDARLMAEAEPESVCEHVLRSLGKDTIAIVFQGKEYSPEQIVAMILRKVADDAEEVLDAKADEVVVVYPGCFGPNEKIALSRAAGIAGLHMAYAVPRHEAVVFGYGMHKQRKDQSLLVFGMGGTCFSVTVWRMAQGDTSAVAGDGDFHIGGKNWNEMLMDYLEYAFREQTGFDGEFGREAMQDLRLKAEKAKQQLTAKTRTKVTVLAGGVKARIELTREKFESITNPLLMKVLGCVEDVLRTAQSRGCGHIDQILLAGGGCKMPQVREALKKAYPNIPIMASELEGAAAKGAVIYGEYQKENFHSTSKAHENKGHNKTITIQQSERKEVQIMENKAFGIDLGTTYSCISYVDDISGEPVVVDNSEGTNVTPSIVCFEDEDTIVVGDVAKETAVVTPESTCEFVKRRMGVDSVAITYNEKDYSPEQISSLILKKLVKDAEAALDTEIKDVVITCPAYFGIAERTATENAGKMAGLNVLEIINEPTAAALCYGSLRGEEDKTILVYDLGGGTFDVTIIRVTPQEIVAIATDGDHQLGGKDWDSTLMDYLEEEFKEQKDFDEEFDLEAQQDLRLKAEKAKQQLTAKPKTKVIVQANGVKASIELTREKFEEITSPLLKKTVDLTNDAMAAAAQKGVTEIDEIILVGGSCKMPQVKAAVEAAYPNIPIKMFEPNEAVAKGAALHADSLLTGNRKLQEWKDEIGEIISDVDIKKEDGTSVTIEDITDNEVPDDVIAEIEKEVEKKGGDARKVRALIGGAQKKPGPVLKNITSKSFGIQVVVDVEVNGEIEKEDRIANLITKQDPVPASVTQEFGTAYANMENAEIIVYETDVTDELYEVGGNMPLGTAILELPPNLPEGSPVEITIELSTDGLLSLRGFEKTGNKEVKATMQSDAILTEEEVTAQAQALSGLVLN